MGNAAGASYLLDMLANGLVLFDALYRNHGISGLCGELYELADRIAPALTRTLAHGKTLVSISERRLHSVLAALEKCRAALLVNADPETAQLLSLAILQLRMKLNRIGDTELKALCDAMTQNEAPLESTQGGRRRSPPVLKLVK